MDSTADYRSVNAAVVSTGTSLGAMDGGHQHARLSTWPSMPTASLLVRAGVRLLKEDVQQLDDGVSDPLTSSKRIKTAWPIASVFYEHRRGRCSTIRGDIQETNTGTAYTAISPHYRLSAAVIRCVSGPIDKSFISKTAEWCAIKSWILTDFTKQRAQQRRHRQLRFQRAPHWFCGLPATDSAFRGGLR